MDERIKPYESKMTKTLESLEREYASIRAGRANPHVWISLLWIIMVLPHRFSRWAIFLFPRRA